MKIVQMWWSLTRSLIGLLLLALIVGLVIGLVLGVRLGLAWDGDLVAFGALRR